MSATRRKPLSAQIFLCSVVIAVGGLLHARAPALRMSLNPAKGVPQQPKSKTLNREPPWNTAVRQSGDGRRIISATNLTGIPFERQSFVEIASGAFQNWQWTVKAESSVLPSWNTYENAQRVKKSARLPADDWSYPGFDWKRAFGRTYLAAKYLLGHEPMALNATVLLIPDGQRYRCTLDQTEGSAVPITLGFWFPAGTSSSKAEQGKRQTTILQAVTEITHQYSRILSDESIIAEKGEDDASKDVNKEAVGACWMESTALAVMAAGGHFRSSMHWNQQTAAEQMERHRPSKISPDEVGYWASLREAESISSYLEAKGMKNHSFSGNDPAAMNAVLSVCRAMTQHPLDLTSSWYPASQIQYVPFFPVPLNSRRANQ